MSANPIHGASVMMRACAACSAPPLSLGEAAPRGRAFSLVSSTLLVLMPKCPLCFVGWAGAFGLGSYATHAALIPTAVLALFCASQAVFFFTARRTGGLRSLLIAALGVSLILAGTQLHLGAAVCLAGVALLVLASVWNAVATTRARAVR